MILFIIGLIFGIIFIVYVRDDKAIKFKCHLIDLNYDWINRNENTKIKNRWWFSDKSPSHHKLVWSFKPFKLESWYSEEDINKINK